MAEPKYKVGQKIVVEGRTKYIKVMAYSEGWYMVRYKGCVPFVKWWKDLEKLLTPKTESNG